VLGRSVIGMVLWGLALVAAAADLREVRLWAAPDSTRVVFDLSAATPHRVFTLDNPPRIVVDLEGLSPQAVRVANGARGRGVVQRVRSAMRGDRARGAGCEPARDATQLRAQAE
jgi:N-acetylmuramoyl-L-alanine amidase